MYSNNNNELLHYFPYLPTIKKIGNFSIGYLKLIFNLNTIC